MSDNESMPKKKSRAARKAQKQSQHRSMLFLRKAFGGLKEINLTKLRVRALKQA
jgi:hypothetical protein